ncbi:hypothetical protein [Spiribacter roseus]|uniref:hypothetical protein n=1 Tax=Spiribacter roseus TaxID=1855875 RepID=UPI001F222335|nr:hypothetical protein [Spiribacter roseus]
MRDCYPVVLLEGDGCNAASLFFEGIRYSTHCEYWYTGCGHWGNAFSFPHMTAITSDESLDPWRSFFFEGNRFEILYPGKTSRVNDRDCFARSKSCLIPEQSFLDGIKQVEYIKNADGEYEYLCSLSWDNLPAHAPIQLSSLLGNDLINDDLALQGAQLISVRIGPKGLANRRSVVVRRNTSSSVWRLYRLIGINIPLLLVQVALGRRVKTVPMVDQEDITLIDGCPKYVLEEKGTFWFDLDETLICRDLAVTDVVQLCCRLRKNGKKVNLLTRHAKDIDATLKLIGLNYRDFGEVVRVGPSEKKSSYVLPEDVFIDNEYPQRLDVRLNCKAMVLDLDQIDFIRIYGASGFANRKSV